MLQGAATSSFHLPSNHNNMSPRVTHGSYKIIGPRCQTSSNFQPSSTTNTAADANSADKARSLGRPRNMRIVDNAQERILKRIEDQKMLDTTPNADVNDTWNKQVRKRDMDKEIGPAFKYKHRNTIERLEDQAMKDPLSSEVVGLSSPNASPLRSQA